MCFALCSCNTSFTPRRLQTVKTVSVDFSIAEPEQEWFPLTAVWADRSGNQQSVSIATSSFTLNLPSDVVTPILIDIPDSEHPIGCVYPANTICTPAGGWAAHILFQFLKKTQGQNVRIYASQFNWKKLMDTASKIENPWQLDEETILNAIADGTFETSLVTGSKSR